eukprot:GFKZ01005758.1.p1 GENE.GFKZ01005758.1~~GFKZ01005758.1.p1  ORF type:complete len:781 (-),score=98.95 GFKZ01005758.1:1057-3399(-)
MLRRHERVRRLVILHSRTRNIGIAPHRPSQHRSYCEGLTHSVHDEVVNHKAGINGTATVIRNVREAARAVTALLQLPESKEVAWSVQKANSPIFESYPCTLSAYGGNEVDFGSGPHLVLPVNQHGSESQPVWELFKEYFTSEQSRKVWHDHSVMQQVLSTKSIIPKGVSAELIGMATLVETPPRDKTLQGLVKDYWSTDMSGGCPSITQKSISRKKSRPWENIKKRKMILVDETWINAACSDAELVLSLYKKLRSMLSSSLIRNERSSLAFTTNFATMDQVYNHFFAPMVEQLHAIQSKGVGLDNTANTEVIIAQIQGYEQEFVRWASTFSPKAQFMDPNNKKQLRQVLFGPRTGSTDVQKTLSGTDEDINISCQHAHHVSPVTRKKLKATELQGYGGKAAKLTKTLTPSVSDHALRQTVKYGRARKEGFERNDSAFCDAVEKLLRAKEMRAKLHAFSDEKKKLTGKQRRAEISYSVCASPSSARLPGEKELDIEIIRGGLVADSGNTLLTGRYLDLDTELLYFFSGCKELESRLEKGFNVHEQLALHLFDEVRVASEAGQCILSPHPPRRDEHLETQTISQMFPELFRKTTALNWCMIRGYNDASVQAHVDVEKQEGERLMKEWHKLHPGVSVWHKKCEQDARENSFIETLMCRKVMAYAKRNRKRTMVAMSDILEGLMDACTEEILMQAAVKLATEQTLQALNWQVVFIDGDRVALEGPKYAAAVALDILEYEMEAVLGSKLPIEIMGGDSIGKLRILTRDEGSNGSCTSRDPLRSSY